MQKQQADKELLYKDLCARLPNKCRVFYEYIDDIDGKTYGYSLTLNTWCIDELEANKAIVKPYLYPMSSMTEEECIELGNIQATIENISEVIPNVPYYIEVAYSKQIDWLNSHHFDYRGLIERGLAIEVTKENNPYETKLQTPK